MTVTVKGDRNSTQTFGSADDQAKLCTHRHTHHFLVVTCQNCPRCWVVGWETGDTRKHVRRLFINTIKAH